MAWRYRLAINLGDTNKDNLEVRLESKQLEIL